MHLHCWLRLRLRLRLRVRSTSGLDTRFGCGLSLAGVYGIALAEPHQEGGFSSGGFVGGGGGCSGSQMGGFSSGGFVGGGRAMGSKWRGGGVAGWGGGEKKFARDGIAWTPKRGLDLVAIMGVGDCGVLEGRGT